MKKIIAILFFLLTVSALNAQITVSLSIEYQKNNDTILRDSLVPQLRIELQNKTDTAQYVVLENYEKYPKFMFSSFGCPNTPEQWFKNLETFRYFKCNDYHKVIIENFQFKIQHKNLHTIDEEMVEDDFISSDFYSAHNFLQKYKQNHINHTKQIILLDKQESYFLTYDLTYFAVVGGEYEFIFEMKPPDNSFPNMIAYFQKCKEFIVKSSLKFKP